MLQTKSLVIAIFVLAAGFAQNRAQAETRTFRGQKGETLRAEFTGVMDGQVALKAGRKRIRQEITDFSLADRDYICDRLRSRRPEKILELLQKANMVQPDDRTQQPVEKTFYGLQVPSIGMLAPLPPREFQDVAGNSVTASFERLVLPFHVRLSSDGQSVTYPLVYFVKEDIEYIRQTIEDDMKKPVFPSDSPSQFQSGYEVFTDRLGVQLTARFISANETTLTLEVDGEQQSYPINGLPMDEQRRVENKRKQSTRDTDSDRRSSSNAGRTPRTPQFPSPTSPFSPGSRMPAMPGFSSMADGEHGNGNDEHGDGGMNAGTRPRSTFPESSSRFSPARPGFRGGIGSSITTPQYEFHCDRCQHEWSSHSPVESCPNCRDQYDFSCDKCGHTWSLKGKFISKCPRCQESHGSSGSRLSLRNQGRLVGRGLGLLFSIAFFFIIRLVRSK